MESRILSRRRAKSKFFHETLKKFQSTEKEPKMRMMKIGDMLVAEGLITLDQLDEALDLQQEQPDKKIGEILLELGYVSIEDFERILHLQLETLDELDLIS
jgi:hypothetical protein